LLKPLERVFTLYWHIRIRKQSNKSWFSLPFEFLLFFSFFIKNLQTLNSICLITHISLLKIYFSELLMSWYFSLN
jgi:hypothetical protein